MGRLGSLLGHLEIIISRLGGPTDVYFIMLCGWPAPWDEGHWEVGMDNDIRTWSTPADHVTGTGGCGTSGFRPIPPPCMGCVAEASGRVVGVYWGLVGRPLGGLIGASWMHLGGPLEGLLWRLSVASDWGASLEAFRGPFLGRLGSVSALSFGL